MILTKRGQEKQTAVCWALQPNDPSCSYPVTSSVKAIAGQQALIMYLNLILKLSLNYLSEV